MPPAVELNPILLLRGWMRDARHWETFPGMLEQALQQSDLQGQVLCPDLPGNGRRFRETSPARIEEMVQDYRHKLGHGPFILVGLSMGGMIASAWAQQYPSEVRQLFLINSSMQPFAKPWERLRPRVWPRLLTHLKSPAEKRERLIQNLTLSPQNRSEERLARWVNWSESHPVSTSSTLNQLRAAARFHARKTPPVCPTTIISGEQDQLVNPICSHRLAKAWNARHERHPEAGHDLPLEAPEWLSQTLVKKILEFR